MAEEPIVSPARWQRVQHLAWSLAFVANAGVGAWLLSRSAPPEPPSFLAFALFFVAALIVFMATQEQQSEPQQSAFAALEQDQPAARLRRLPRFTLQNAGSHWRLALLLLALLAVVYLLYLLPRLDRLANHTLASLLWLGAMAAYALAVAPPRANLLPRLAARLKLIWQQRRAAVLLLLAIMLAALVLRAAYLEAIPYTLGGDEASQGIEAVRVLQGEIRNPFTTGWLGVPTLSFFFNSITIDWLGMTKTGLRLPWALVGTATVVACFFLVKQLQGVTLALATSALLAVYHYHVHFSRLGSNQIADPFFVTASLMFLYHGMRKQRMWAWVATGVCAGAAFYFYAGARFTPIVVAALLFFALLQQPRAALQAHGRGILAMGGAFLVAAAPMLQYALRFPDDFNARINQVGIIQSGWLARELENGNALLPTLWEQLRRAALAFNYYPDRTVWYGLLQPLLDPVFGALFAVGLLLCTLLVVLRRDQRVLPYVLWWWGGMIAGGMLTESPPSAQRLTTLTVPVCFFIAFVLWRFGGLLQVGLLQAGAPRLSRKLVLSLGVALFAIISLRLYFFEYTPQIRYGGRHAELATTLAPFLQEVEETHDAYFVGAPWMYWGFSTIPYLAPGMNGQDLEQQLTAPPPTTLLRPARGALFIVRPERIDELPLIQQTFPQGRLLQITSRAPERELLGTLYYVPPAPGP